MYSINYLNRKYINLRTLGVATSARWLSRFTTRIIGVNYGLGAWKRCQEVHRNAVLFKENPLSNAQMTVEELVCQKSIFAMHGGENGVLNDD